jgi:hypothetical protein
MLINSMSYSCPAKVYWTLALRMDHPTSYHRGFDPRGSYTWAPERLPYASARRVGGWAAGGRRLGPPGRDRGSSRSPRWCKVDPAGRSAPSLRYDTA